MAIYDNVRGYQLKKSSLYPIIRFMQICITCMAHYIPKYVLMFWLFSFGLIMLLIMSGFLILYQYLGILYNYNGAELYPN